MNSRNETDALYREYILEIYRNPKNFGILRPNTFCHCEKNTYCGDSIELSVRLNRDQKVSAVRYHGQGCVISQVSASLMTQTMKGKTVQQILELSVKDIETLLGVHLSGIRIRCGALILKTFQHGWKKVEKSSRAQKHHRFRE